MTAKGIGIFAAGVVVGAIGGALITARAVAEKYCAMEDEHIAEVEARYDEKFKEQKAIEAELREEIKKKDIAIEVLEKKAAGISGANEPEGDNEEDESGDDDSSDSDPSNPGVGQRQAGKDDERGQSVEEDRRWRRQNSEQVETYSKNSGYYYEEDDEYDPDEIEYPLEDDNYHEDEDAVAEAPYIISEYEFAETNCGWAKESFKYYPYDGSVISEDDELIDNFEKVIGTEWLGELRKVDDEVYIRNEELQMDVLVTLCSGIGVDNLGVNLDD